MRLEVRHHPATTSTRESRGLCSAFGRLVVVLAFMCRAQLASAQVVEYDHLDALGSVRAITNQAGAVIERHDYLPFGEEWTAQPTADPRKFTGKERDAETGLDYFGARYYASGTARFASVDPVITLDENLVDPQRWNRYVYVRNNPLRYTDPDGRVLDTLFDIASIGYDLFDIGRSAISGQGVSWTQGAALGADVLSAVVPFASGGGVAVRAAAKANAAVDTAQGALKGVDDLANAASGRMLKRGDIEVQGGRERAKELFREFDVKGAGNRTIIRDKTGGGRGVAGALEDGIPLRIRMKPDGSTRLQAGDQKFVFPSK